MRLPLARCGLVALPSVVVGALLLLPTVPAWAGDPLPRPTGVSPADLFTVQQSRPLEGFSFGAGAVTQFLRLPAAGATPRDDRVGHDLLVGGSLWGYFQLDVALPVRFYLGGRSRPDGTFDTGLQAGLDGLRLTSKLAIPGVHRRFDGAGLGVALLFRVDFPTAVPGPREATWRPAAVVDRRWVLGRGFRLLLAGNLGVALRQSDFGQLVETSITYGVAARVLLIPPWRVSAFLGADGAFGVSPTVRHGGVNVFGGFQWFGRSCYTVSATAGVRPGEPGGAGWFVGAGFGKLWGGECRAQRGPRIFPGAAVIGRGALPATRFIGTAPPASLGSQSVRRVSFTPPFGSQNPPRKAPDTVATALTDRSPIQAFAQMHRQLHHQIEALFAGLDRVQNKPASGGWGLVAGNGFGEYVAHVRSKSLRDIEAILDEGWALAQKSETTAEPERSRRSRAAGIRFEAAQILIQVLELEIDLVIVASYADTAGVPFGAVRARLQAFDDQMLPVVQAAVIFDPKRMQAALGQVEAQYQKQVEALDQSMRAIDKNAQLSSKVIQIANVLTLAMALYDVARIPVVGGSGIGTSGPPRIPAFSIAGISGGGAAVMGSGIDVQAVAATAEAVRKLVAIGALDPGVITGVTKLGGGAGTLAELQKPSLLWSEGSGHGGDSAPERQKHGEAAERPPKNPVRSAVRRPVPGLWNAEYGPRWGGGGSPRDRAYAKRVTGQDDSLYADGVEFDGYDPSRKVLLDAKRSTGAGSWYDISSTDRFTRRVKIPRILEQARRQREVLAGSGAVGIEWHVSNETIAAQLRQLFKDRNINVDVVFTPE